MDVLLVRSEEVLEPSRRRYGRDKMLAVKEVLSSRTGTFDDIFNSAAISQRGLRGKTKPTFPKNRSRDTSNIVLGPQKRSWNTGCHVSHASIRESNGDIGRGKSGCDQRGSERTYNRFTSELKKDHRGTGRDRGNVRRVDNTSMSRLHRDDRNREPRHPIDEEPEWFSEGPTTVTETIELGQVLDVLEEEASVQRKQVDRGHPTSTVNTKPADNVFHSEPSKSTQTEATPCLTSTAPIFESPVNTSVCPPTESQGSRFKYLFNESTTPTPSTKTGSVNDQLLQLLKGCNSLASGSSPEKSNVIQVENKLRSILLGHGLPRQPVNNVISSDHCSSKPQILTVEEIEARLRLGSSAPSPAVTSDSHFFRESNTEVTEILPSDPAQFKIPQSTGDSYPSGYYANLAPILQSFTSKQTPQPTCTRPSRLNPLNLFSTPVTQLSATNAVSASPRINHLQQVDYSNSSTRDAVYQGVLRHIWDNTHLNNPHKILQAPSTFAQRSTTGPPGCLPDFGSRLGLGINQPYILPDTNRSVAPRRPIVKAQQGVINPSVHTLSHMTSSGSVASPHYTSLDDIDRRLFNLNFKQQSSGCDSIHHNSTLSTTSSDLRFSAPGAPLFPNSTPISLASTNTASCTDRIPPNRHNSSNAFAFLSQLMDVSDLGSPVDSQKQPPFSLNLLGSGVKAKTLEEIEHQEVTSGSPFF